MKKDWFRSKTLWTALCSFVLVAATELFADPAIAERIKEIMVWLLPAMMGLLRLVTREGLELRSEN